MIFLFSFVSASCSGSGGDVAEKKDLKPTISVVPSAGDGVSERRFSGKEENDLRVEDYDRDEMSSVGRSPSTQSSPNKTAVSASENKGGGSDPNDVERWMRGEFGFRDEDLRRAGLKKRN
jgi:hypothetical protein